jgi:tetratricopeptide (TPR) repeat protein
MERLEQLRSLDRLGDDPNPAKMFAVSAYGRMLAMRGADTEGIALMRHGYEWIHDGHAALHAKLGYIAKDLARANLERGRPDRALTWAERALDHDERQYGDDDSSINPSRYLVARAHLELQRIDDAAVTVEEYARAAPDEAYPQLLVHRLRGDLARQRGRHAQARREYLAALERMEPAWQSVDEAALRGELYAGLADALRGLGQDASAIDALAREALGRGSWWDRRRATASPPADSIALSARVDR